MTHSVGDCEFFGSKAEKWFSENNIVESAEWDSDSDEREFDGVGQFYAGAGKDVTS